MKPTHEAFMDQKIDQKGCLQVPNKDILEQYPALKNSLKRSHNNNWTDSDGWEDRETWGDQGWSETV